MRDDSSARTPVPPAPVPAARGLGILTDKLAALFGIRPADRGRTVAAMLDSRRRSAAGYWLQLLLAMAIATLGLVLGSTAVVIGAMLVSPLMTPIIELGMGLAIGSPLLVLRSALRVGASVAAVIGSAAALTLAIPIHEVTSEIAARTSPTALDLAIASCCAIAGVYAAIRPGSDTASAAAGTAIGIALVPPLCVVGYGTGTASGAIAGGAALLFTANFCGILVFSVLGFLLLGYGQVPVGALERAYAERTEPSGLTARMAHRLSAFFASKLGPLVRVAMPVLLALAVYWPLRSALAQVTWEVRVRAAVQDALRALPGTPVQSNLHIEGRHVALRIVAVGNEADALRMQRTLVNRISPVAGADPSVEVIAVADAQSLARASAVLRAPAIAPSPPAAPKPPDLATVRERLDTALAPWPAKEAGPLLASRLVLARERGAVIELVHLGHPLGGTAESLLAGSLSRALDGEVRIRDVAVPTELSAPRQEGAAWLLRATETLTVLRETDPAGVFVCIEAAAGDDVDAVASALRASKAFRGERTTLTEGEAWSMRISMSPCARSADAGADDAPSSAP